MSRRTVISAAAAGSVLALGTPAVAATGADVRTAAALVDRDQLGKAITTSPEGRRVTLQYAPDFHERLSEWLRFWWANAPTSWIAPFQVQSAGTTPDGEAFLLTGIAYTRADRRHSGFDARERDARYWATVASLHHHFSSVTLADTHIRVADGHAGFSGSPAQVGFVRTALATVWQDASSDWEKAAGRAIRWSGREGSISSRAGWANFTRATLRRGLGTEL
ncbi:hypothetical protein AB0M47_29585 [Hamadaea sp. NPDC051192]|uniref:hypothetical protein n=1 Tax=Hamadaea sp. NPDC051192 TaxID=3154940 RepID=UPI003436561D